MKFLINGFFDVQLFPVVQRITEYFRVEKCYLFFNVIKNKLSVDTIYLDRNSIFWNADYAVDWNEIKPLDSVTIDCMHECEVCVLKMMDRMVRDKEYSYDERKAIYLKHLRYWNHFLNVEKIDLFLSSNIPHEIYDYIIYSLCKVKKISTIFLFHQMQIVDSVLLVDDWRLFGKEIEREYVRLKTKKQSSTCSLSGKFKEDFIKHTSDKNDITPFYTSMIREGNYFKIIAKYICAILIKSVKNPIKLYSSLIDKKYWVNRFRKEQFIPRKLIRNIIMSRHCDRYVVNPDMNRKYIYLPLHVQPELSTSPLGGAYVNQILIAQLISYYLPEDVFIYVKEHPMQDFSYRGKNYYNELMKIKNVKLIKRNCDSRKLIDNCLAVATVTGTPGWEALYRCKPVLMFGNYFYQYAPGVLPIKTKNECKKAIDRILNGKFKLKLEDFKLFIKALENCSIKGVADPCYRKVSELSNADNINNLSRALIKRLDNLF